MKISGIIFLLTMVFFNSSCAMNSEKSWEPVCWHKALYSAIAVNDIEQKQVRIVRGKLRGRLHDQSQFWDEDSNEWRWLSVDQFGVHADYLEGFTPEEYFSLYEYLKFTEEHFFKTYSSGSTVVIN